MCTIAERLVVAQSASAERDCCSTGKIELVSLLIEYLEVPLDSDASVIFYSDFCRHKFLSLKKH
jgi:hypothetical protein